MEEPVYAKIIDGDIIFYFSKGYTQKELFNYFKKELVKMKSFFNIGDSFYVYFEDGSQHNLLNNIIKYAKNFELNVAGAYFGKIPEGKVGNKELNLSSTQIYRKHLRSGQIIQNPGDIIVFGNVNQGAEVNAGGSIIIFGKVYGTIRAGLTQRKNVFIIAYEMNSPLVEIAGIPFFNYEWPRTPISIRIEEEKALVEPVEL
ncbi:septum site-determining protein MinC [Petrotoga sp. 9PWA.NaAc.5.4]|uniref:septum site-determining protein MinC n=1 Tax=Petrotoga sp. 9PWA.NaAc.5.4 TaxID=1434328 RepID=UPI000CAC1C47|nr:septum site-determining protein MinC [Petrotoga sp. 9PWA.NaAc.5.4]PNR94802.1 semialdehyde dehydrogenase [Petrotoga sp. 9PWA.NaAc.5.4]